MTGSLLDEAEKQFDALIAGKEKDAKKLGQQNERMCLLLECLKGREDTRTEKLLLTMFEQVGRLAAIKGTPSGNDVVERLVSVMAAGAPSGAVRARSMRTRRCRRRASVRRSSPLAGPASRPRSSRLFSPYLTAGVNEKKKNRDPAWAKREAIIRAADARARRWADPDAEESSVSADLDPRWLDLAVRLGRSDLVQALAVPGHAGANEFLATLFRQGLGKAGKES